MQKIKQKNGATLTDRQSPAERSEPERFRAIVGPAALLFAVMTVMTGLIYPAAVTLLAGTFFGNQAEGSLIHTKIANKDIIVGSRLLGQNFSETKYFHGRPSATTPAYNASASSGSNLGPTSKTYLATVAERSADIRAQVSDKNVRVPVDLVTASGSGLDPDISPAAAAIQIDRVAQARKTSYEKVQRLVAEHTKGRQLGVLGEPRVNVVELNIALDNQMP